jgi:16S rRNA (uracil1498-N3)-methyltransferase
MKPLRSLPRLFVPGASPDSEFELPEAEVNKLRHVLRLSSGAEIAVLPNDGTLIRCELQGHRAVPKDVFSPNTEASLRLTIAQSLPKGDKIDEIVKACTGLGVHKFLLFSSDRTVVHWDDKKRESRLRRLRAIAREEAEVSYRTRIPEIEFVPNFGAVLDAQAEIVVLSEGENVAKPLAVAGPSSTLVVGPEGGWSPNEVAAIGDRGVTLGPRVLRVEFAAAAAAARLLL